MPNGTLRESVCPVVTKLNTPLPCDAAIVLISIYRKELKTHVSTKTCTHIVGQLKSSMANLRSTKTTFGR